METLSVIFLIILSICWGMYCEEADRGDYPW